MLGSTEGVLMKKWGKEKKGLRIQEKNLSRSNYSVQVENAMFFWEPNIL